MKFKLRIRDSEVPLLREVVADRIREALVRGDLKPGQRLSERWLSERMGVSTSPIKDALRVLEMEGLVKTLPRRGTVVVGLDPSRMEEHAMVRAAVEGVTAYLAAKKITPEGLKRLEKIHQNTIAARERGAPVEELVQSSDDFHVVLAEIAGNEYLQQLVASLRKTIGLVRLSSWYDQSDSAQSSKEHELLMEALRQGDCQEAKIRMENHILSSFRRIVVEKQLEGVPENKTS